MPTINLPPWARWIQQQWWFSLVVVPVLIAMTAAFLSSAGSDLSHVTLDSFVAAGEAAKKTILALIGIWLAGAMSHPFGSASFNKDGTVNKQVVEIVKADTDNKPVAVVPVSSPELRDRIREVVGSGIKVDVVPVGVSPIK